MDQFKKLTKRVNEYEEKHDSLPHVKISREFWEAHASEIAQLSKEGVNITVVDNIILDTSFIFEEANNEKKRIETLNDLKQHVDQLVEEGKGNWPVLHKSLHGEVYVPILITPIVPGDAPYEGLKLESYYMGAPESEHVLIEFDSDS